MNDNSRSIDVDKLIAYAAGAATADVAAHVEKMASKDPELAAQILVMQEAVSGPANEVLIPNLPVSARLFRWACVITLAACCLAIWTRYYVRPDVVAAELAPTGLRSVAEPESLYTLRSEISGMVSIVQYLPGGDAKPTVLVRDHKVVAAGPNDVRIPAPPNGAKLLAVVAEKPTAEVIDQALAYGSGGTLAELQAQIVRGLGSGHKRIALAVTTVRSGVNP